MGLVVAPRIRFLQKSQNKACKDSQPKDSNDSENEDESDEEDQEEDDQAANDTDDDENDKNNFSIGQKVVIKKTEVKIQNTKKKIIRRLPTDKNKDAPLNFSELTNGGDDNDDSLFTVKSVFKPKINKNESGSENDVIIILFSYHLKLILIY